MTDIIRQELIWHKFPEDPPPHIAKGPDSVYKTYLITGVSGEAFICGWRFGLWLFRGGHDMTDRIIYWAEMPILKDLEKQDD